MIIQNTADGGTNGVTVTTGNSGGASGDAFPLVSIGASATLTYSNVQKLHGPNSFHLTSTSTPGGIYFGWNNGPSATTMYLRAYMFFVAAPGAISHIFSFINTTPLIMSSVGVSAGGKFTVLDKNSTVILTSTTSVPAGQWFRLEYKTVSSTTVGQMELKIFLDPHSNTPDETLTTTATQNTLGGNICTAIFGFDIQTANMNMYMDSVAADSAGYLGAVPTYPIGWMTLA